MVVGRKSGLALSPGNIVHPLALGASYFVGFEAGWNFELHTAEAWEEYVLVELPQHIRGLPCPLLWRWSGFIRLFLPCRPYSYRSSRLERAGGY